MTTTIRADSPREMLALIPFQLGFRPTESVVVVSVRQDSTVGLVARMDLADLTSPETACLAADALVGHLQADGAALVVAVVYTDEDLRHRAREQRSEGAAAAALAAVTDAVTEVIGRLETWVVGPAGYYAPECVDRSCCPEGGRPLSDLQATQVGAHMVLHGVCLAPNREALASLVDVGADARRAARRARVRWEARGPAADGPMRGGAELGRWRTAGLRLWREQMRRAEEAWEAHAIDDGGRRWGPCPWDPPPAATAGRLLAALDDVLVRDAVLLTWLPGAERVAERVLAGDRGADVGEALGAIVDPVQGRAPDPGRCMAARAVLQHVAAHAPRSGHAPALTLLALLSWWEGDGARATVLVERALAADPDHHLAALLEDALAAGMAPGWVARRGR